jgi:hypothetical protein
MSIIFALTTLVSLTSTVPDIPPTFHGTYVMMRESCAQAGVHDTITIKADGAKGHSFYWKTGKLKQISATKIDITSENWSDEDEKSVVISSTLALSRKGQRLLITDYAEDGKKYKKPLRNKYRKCE